jgi:UDP-N-acetylmuramate dehydrogenase
MNDLIERKKKDQPSRIKTCGSTFKNPENNKAWKLIKDSGCEGMHIGDAHVSIKHCNFFVNRGKAKAKDLENLIIEVQKKVFKKTGINLEPEVQIIGKKI